MTKNDIIAYAETIPGVLNSWMNMVSSQTCGRSSNGRLTFPLLSWHEFGSEMDDNYMEKYKTSNGRILENEIAEVICFITEELEHVGFYDNK